MNTHEVYSNPPLRLVSAELRFPLTRRVTTPATWSQLEDAFGVELPDADVPMNFVEDGQLRRQNSLTPVVVRRSEARDRSLILSYGALRIEFSRYEYYEQLRDFLMRALIALRDLPTLNRISRIGLRCVNEIPQPPELTQAEEGPSGWESYIQPQLIPRLADVPEPLEQSWFSSNVSFSSKAGADRTFLSYGPIPQGVVAADGPLKLVENTGPCFLLDIDTYERRGKREGWLTNTEGILEVLDKLHENIEAVFYYCVTDKLRDEVFRVQLKKSGDEQSGEISAGAVSEWRRHPGQRRNETRDAAARR